MKDFHIFIYDEVQITSNVISLKCFQTHCVICAVIDKITQGTEFNGEWQSSFISFDEAVLQVITQSDFLSWDLQIFIYLISLMTIS